MQKQTAMQPNPLRSREDVRVLEVYRAVRDSIDLDAIIPSCLAIAKEVEGLKGLKGPEKLQTLQRVLHHAVRCSLKSPEEKEAIVRMIDTVVPFAIQAAILATKSPIVAQVQSTCIGCWTKTKRS